MVSATEIYCTLSFGVHLWKPEKKILHPLHSIKRLFLKRIERTTLLLATLDYNLKKKDLKRTSLLLVILDYI